MPERVGDSANNFYYSATWVHELGHLLFGYSDYYYSRFNIGSWALSGNHGAVPTHPAAFEKWLFVKGGQRGDYYRDPNLLPNLRALQANIRLQRELGFLNADLDVRKHADLSIVREAAKRPR